MKPIYLKMSAFGPFLHEETVDFDRISQNGLFLITGQTGSGKTTIFDAITFALYGEASGSNRDVKTLRSDLAKEEETYVELTFELRDKIYKIYRSPSYLKEGRKTAIPAKANLYLNDGTIISTPRDVNNKILELIGLDVHQFKQIAMIAQGEFTKLLFASSDEKEKIFRKIFNTFKYDQFEGRLKEKVNLLNTQVNDANIEMKTLINTINLPDTGDKDAYFEVLKEKVEDVSKQYNTLKVESEQLSIQIKDLNIHYEKEMKHNEEVLQKKELQEKLNFLLAKNDQFKQKDQQILYIEKANTLVPYEREVLSIQKRIQDDTNSLNQIKSAFEANKETFENISEQYQELPKLNESKENMLILANNYQKQLEDRNKQKELLADKKKLELKIRQTESDIEILKKKEETFQYNFEVIDQQVNKLKELILKKEEIKLRLEGITKKINAYNETVQLQSELDRISQYHRELSEKYLLFDAKVSYDEEVYKKHYTMFLNMQAGILASSLEEGKPCPVCGSIHHPSIAPIHNTNITSDTLDQEAAYLQNEKDQKDQLYKTVYEVNSKKQTMQEKINKNIEEYELKEVSAQGLRDTYNTYVIEYEKIEQAGIQILRLEKEREEEEQQQKENSQLLEKRNQFKEELNQASSTIEGQLLTIGQIDEQLDENIRALNAQYTSITRKISVIEDNFAKMQQYIEHFHGQEIQLNQSLLGNQEKLKEKNKAWMEMLQEFSTYEEYKEYCNKISILPVLRKEVQDHLLEIEKLKAMISNIQLEEDEIIDITPIKQMMEENTKQYNEKLEILQKIYNQMDSYTRVYNKLTQIYSKNKEKVKEYQIYYELYNVTCGNNPQKLSFERYILSAYFEQIILLANVRFKDMTNHRYALVRKETRSSRQSGLDLQIRDYQNGTIREITTLSGGESFKAALSLALGLSDMIQNVAGGIELNTLFIDEGFGSLDQESLDQAITVLNRLNENNKMIGIISHVTELKQRIDNQLNVVKTNKGSYIEVR